jgi:putative FmdB family regulatory protein
MPIYEYQCSSCQKVIEVMQRITEEPLSHCPDCHGSVKKLVSMSAFHLKGGGWFADGYSGTSGKNGKSAGKGNGSAPEPASKAATEKPSSSVKSDGKSSSTPKVSSPTASQ